MFVILDLETTGLSSNEDAIIECAFVKIERENFQEVDRYTTFVNPERDIPELISQITNIFDSDVARAPKFWDIRGDIEDFIQGLPLIGHNISFDISFLQSHGIDCSKNLCIDTFTLANFLCYDIKSLNLWYLCEHFSIELESAHRAIDDTIATKSLFQKLIEALQISEQKSPILIWYYFDICEDVALKIIKETYLPVTKKNLSGEEVFDEYRKNLRKNKIDITDTPSNISISNIEEFLENKEGFELREGQKTMLRKVDKTFKEWSKVLIEAPTGIGKTFAYLLPAIEYSLRFWEAVHISTSTKALQDQIYYKDLDFLHQEFNAQFTFTKLKGRKNYLGIHALSEFVSSSEKMTATRLSFILKILLWSSQSEYGELDELNFYGEEFSFLSEIHAWDAYIFDTSNTYKDVEFALRARDRAKTANIIITNNHILFQDMSSEGSLLWGVKNLVLDEAHSLEDIVTQSLKKTISFQNIQKLLQKIWQKSQKYKLKQDFSLASQQILFDTAELFSILEGVLFSKFRLDHKYKSLSLTKVFFDSQEDLFILAQKVLRWLQEIQNEIQNLWKSGVLRLSRESQEISYFSQILLEVFEFQDHEKYIYYTTHDDKRWTQLHTTLLRPWDFLTESLWDKLDSVVLTSATLQMGNSFSYIQKMLHVADFETLSLESDFDYEKQALVFIPHDLGNIKENLPQVRNFLESFFWIVQGRTLVLFTAFAAIRDIFSNLKIKMQKKNIHLLAQSISWSKGKQIDFFKTHAENSILLWTDTFWEGIDIPWESLKYLIVHKIPFSVPTDPIFVARARLFDDSFWDYAIPKSILKLKQGFGRLIRSKTDSWIIIFLDNRIYDTHWGKRFLLAFPKGAKIRYWKCEKLIELLQNQ